MNHSKVMTEMLQPIYECCETIQTNDGIQCTESIVTLKGLVPAFVQNMSGTCVHSSVLSCIRHLLLTPTIRFFRTHERNRIKSTSHHSCFCDGKTECYHRFQNDCVSRDPGTHENSSRHFTGQSGMDDTIVLRSIYEDFTTPRLESTSDDFDSKLLSLLHAHARCALVDESTCIEGNLVRWRSFDIKSVPWEPKIERRNEAMHASSNIELCNIIVHRFCFRGSELTLEVTLENRPRVCGARSSREFLRDVCDFVLYFSEIVSQRIIY